MDNDSRLPKDRRKRIRNRLDVLRLGEDEEIVEEIPEELSDDMSKFEEFGFEMLLIDAIRELKFRAPTPIQTKAIPSILEGRDVLASAQTGSGKTLAFGLPLLQKLLQNSSDDLPRALILAPTRELVSQIFNDLVNMGKYSKLRMVTIYGGVSQSKQVDMLDTGVDILIATPGRLRDLHRQEHVKFTNIKHVILDEADMMMDMGFIEDIEFFMSQVSHPRQVLLFSATISPQVSELASQFLSSPIIIQEESEDQSPKIDSTIFIVDQADKIHLLIYILQNYPMEKVIVFVKTKRRVDDVRGELYKAGISALGIHGDKDQYQRERIMDTFDKNKQVFMIATDLASRGLDIDDVTHIINYDISPEPEVYIHRIGRTGRAGKTGTAYSFINIKERRFLRRIENYLGYTLPEAKSYRFKSRVPFTRENEDLEKND